MRIGVMSGATQGADGSLDGLVKQAQDLEARGFHAVWMANIFGLDAITTQAIVGRETKQIELGTAVVPTYPRHPFAIAQQALTTAAASGGRFTLGIGLSHQVVIENMMGLSYAKPASHMREYMAVLGPLLRGEPAAYEGNEFKVNGALEIPEAGTVPIVIAALGDRMLRIAGETSEGTILWMTGPATIESHIIPKITAAATEAGRAAPRVVAGFPIVLTNDTEHAKAHIAKALAVYGQLPSYRAMLDKEGAGGAADVAIAGDEKVLDAALDRLRDIGVTDFNAAIMPLDEESEKRTLKYLESRL
ncbi:MAG: LLM class F420-dependent oxidoreductase [Spirochaeta sp.]|nr:LLM class F420-dependent oxidoreductase [Spirochaeta sp.]RPG12486.1 MAG: TIGR03564 family F420-dependent LLM class oxidoreductase [Proteobacteria bacterium TMED72]